MDKIKDMNKKIVKNNSVNFLFFSLSRSIYKFFIFKKHILKAEKFLSAKKKIFKEDLYLKVILIALVQ